MALNDKINGLIKEEVESLGYEMVKTMLRLESRRKFIRVYIDRPDGGVTLDDCVEVTRALGFVLEDLERLSGGYKLEVSSPGFNRPLVKPEHFRRFAGERAKVVFLDEGGSKKSLTGNIREAGDRDITLGLNRGDVRIRFDQILEANLSGAKKVK
ncbi:MAG: ribosome maturation factor [Candidatus Latescibacteria bacterium]|nr:ribosome maturation factor [bacterium]MBD3424560.1 ribosome maturation factor [Candidatus Latescibacterota bacterium]